MKLNAFIKTGKLATTSLWGLLGGAALLIAQAHAEDATIVANRVKSAFLFNFVKYVEWPAEALPAKDTPIVVGIIGKDPIAADIKETLSGKAIESHPLEVRNISDENDSGPCHLLFICASEKKRLPKILESQKTKKVLTVSDVENFEEEGGIIAFRKDGQNIRFRINQKAAEKAGLKVSSKLLQLSK